MTLLLVGDIGGTKTLLRLVEMPTGETRVVASQQENLYEALYSSQEFPDLVPMVRQFLREAGEHLDGTPAPTKACFAIAGPVVGNTSVLTNLGWSLGAQRLQEDLRIALITLINDFAAVGYGVLGLTPAQIHTLQAGRPQTAAPIAVIGAGTGLGQGFLIRQLDDYHVYPSEGGHADFAPRNEIEFALLQYLRHHKELSRVSVERVVSGQGIVAIYQFLRDRASTVGANLPEPADSAAAIASAALEKRDLLCEQTMRIFVEAYGAEAGNLALKLLPYGGLYLAGGIASKVLPLIEEDNRFLDAFTHKGRVSPLLERVPVYVVLNPQVGLIGAAICAARL